MLIPVPGQTGNEQFSGRFHYFSIKIVPGKLTPDTVNPSLVVAGCCQWIFVFAKNFCYFSADDSVGHDDD